MNSKEYTLPNGKKAVFEYDHDGIGKVTIEAMDMLMGLITDGRKRGKWVEVQISENFKRMVCSECGNNYVTDLITPLEAWIDNRHRFCPNCGADMRGKDDEASD